MSNGMSLLIKIKLHCKYVTYLYKTNTTVFTFLAVVNAGKIYLSSTIIGTIRIFVEFVSTSAGSVGQLKNK